jgi:predicted AAA+ superfamily ATPase
MTKEELFKKLNTLKKYGVTTRKIKKNDKTYEYYFLQWTENGKQYSKSINKEEYEIIKNRVENRNSLIDYLQEKSVLNNISSICNCNVIVGKELKSLVLDSKKYKKRYCFKNILNYINDNDYGKVFILYGLRRTGKTTLIKQIINDMNKDLFNKTAFIQITKKDDFASFNKDLKLLQNNGYKYIFIDEVTFMNDFIEGAALLSDIYASSGMKIILSGTDSLGFWFTKSNELYDRSILLHTTFISYKEFNEVLGINGIDKYILYGGTMSVSGNNYNNVFMDEGSTNEYINSSISNNIQHSLKFYQYEGHFRELYDLYKNNELTNAINRVVEDINHRFTIETIEKDFKSNDLHISANNLRKDKDNPNTILDDIDESSFTERLKKLLDIKNKNEQLVKINDIHIDQIKEYLKALDLIFNIDILDINVNKNKREHIVFTQPGLRYSQAESFIKSLLNDNYFRTISIDMQNYIIKRILNEIKGRMAEDIVLLETMLSMKNNRVFKLQFPVGEFDMVVTYPDSLECEIFEIKYSKEAIKEQTRFLIDEEKCNQVSFQFGRIRKKTVLYRGENKIIDGIYYKNIEEYLCELCK